MRKAARVLAIAGSDSGGGAGIQADIKTVTMLGGHAMTAITAVTVQNTLGVSAVHAVPADIIAAQIKVVLDDIGADVVKMGMLGDRQTIDAIASAIAGFSGPIVLDPVMIAKGGAALLADEAVDTLKARLLLRATVVTPNAPEIERLTGIAVEDEAGLLGAARALLATGAAAVLAKGGHLQGDEVVDWLVTADDEQRFSGKRIETLHTHGTGCTLASAVAVGLGQGMTLADAVERARGFVRRALLAAPGFGSGHGPMGHWAA